jgi:WD40 repeat protein
MMRLPAKLKLAKQIPVLVMNVRATGDDLVTPPFNCELKIEALKPSSTAPPPWLLSQQPKGLQQWAIQLPHEQADWQEATLQIEPASHLSDLQVERAHIALLNITGKGQAFPLTRVVKQLSFGGGGETIWGVSEDEVLAWNWPEGKLTGKWSNPGHLFSGAGQVRALQAGKAGTLVGTRDGVVYWLSSDASKTLGVWPSGGQEVTAAALCEPAELALVAADNGKVRVLTIPHGRVLHDLLAADSAVIALAATPDAQWLATASVDCQLKLWRRTQDGYALYCQLPDTSNTVRSLQLSPDGNYLSVLGRATTAVALWDLAQLSSEFRRLEID